jgi:quercetin dioxygenase-like cupin family protein
MSHILHEDKIEAKELPGRKHKMVFGPFEGMLKCERMCGGVAWFPPKSHAGEHTHPKEEEIIYILSGHGAIYFDGEPEDVNPGDFVSIPCGVSHSIRNDADGLMKLLYVFSPPVVQGSYDKKEN